MSEGLVIRLFGWILTVSMLIIIPLVCVEGYKDCKRFGDKDLVIFPVFISTLCLMLLVVGVYMITGEM